MTQQQPQPTKAMPIVNLHVAGIDIGAKFHVVAIGDDPKLHLQQFGVSTPELLQLSQHLKDNHIQNVAMEATGGYESPLVQLLQAEGFTVTVTAGTNTKNYKRIKTDTADAIHIRTLHQLGLLPPIFVPDTLAQQIRPLTRLRRTLIEQSSTYIQLIQKALRAGNIRLDNVLTNTKTVSGMAIIRAICQGQEDPNVLAGLVHDRCKKTKAEIVQLLTGNWTDTLRYEVRTCYELHEGLQAQITRLDVQLDSIFAQHTASKEPLTKNNTPKGRPPKGNAPRFNLEVYARQLLGVDLSVIPGFGREALLGLLAEVGQSLERFPTAKAFAKWLGLSPNNRSSGGKTLSRKTLKNKSSLPATFRMVANCIGNLKQSNPLGSFFQRLAYKSGRIVAVTATARKVAVLVYKLVKTQQAYDAGKVGRSVDEQKSLQVRRMKKAIAKFGINSVDLGLSVDFTTS
jgi:transposase